MKPIYQITNTRFGYNILAIWAGQPIASAEIQVNKEMRQAKIKTVEVHPSMRGLGAGAQLLEVTCKRLKLRKFQVLSMYVPIKDFVGKHLVKNAGFIATCLYDYRRTPTDRLDLASLIYMRKEL